MTRLIMHIDMDAFFAAVEQRDFPELRGKPLIIGALPGGRGVVSTASYEARKFGVGSAMPISEAHRRCPNGIYKRPDMSKYVAESRKVMAALDEISPVVEPVSIDEAYVDITGLERLVGTPQQIGARTKALILERTGLTASVGIGPNRFVAKIASDHQKPDGLTVVEPEQVLEFLGPLPIRVLRGVGKVAQGHFARMSVKTVADLRDWALPDLIRRLGEASARSVYRQARGEGSDRVGHAEGRKSISKETTFLEDIDDPERIRATMLWQAAEVGRTTRRENKRGRVVSVKIRLAGFETHTRQRRMDRATCSDRRIYETAISLYEESGYVGRPLRLIGVGLSDWDDGGCRQLLLGRDDEERDRRLFSAVDKIKERFGNEAIGAGELKNRKPK